MIIQDHVKRIQFTISDLGKVDVFVGYEWLKKHNPDVDWRVSSLFFTRCPDECNYITRFSDIDTDTEENPHHIHLAEGEKLYAFDIDGYLSNQGTFMGDSKKTCLNRKYHHITMTLKMSLTKRTLISYLNDVCGITQSNSMRTSNWWIVKFIH